MRRRAVAGYLAGVLPRFTAPDVLVLGAGGTLGEAWMSGVLAGLEDATGHDFRDTEAFVGTSAGALVAASLVAGQRPRRPDADAGRPGLGAGAPHDDLASEPRTGEAARVRPRDLAGTLVRETARWAAAVTAPLAPTALSLGATGGAPLRAIALAAAPGTDVSLAGVHERVRTSGARFDGRLRIVAVDRARGRRVVFGAPGSPVADVGEAVQASCSVPWIFAPVRIGDREYVDGGVWSTTNIDVAPAGRSTEVLCLNPMSGLEIPLASPYGILRAIAGGASALETMAVRSRGASVRTLGPEADAARLMAPNLMDPRPRDEVRAGGYAQGLRLGGRR
jgi:NTE family protein